MPSPDKQSFDVPINTFGGRVTQYDPQALPIGASPYNQDVVFSGKNPAGVGLVAGVATRPGMKPFYAAPFAGNPTVNYLAQFTDLAGVIHLLSLDGLGNVRDETPCPVPPGVPTIIGTVIAGAIAQSDSLVGREYIAFSDQAHPGFGIDVPRQWDGTNFDRVSQCGPGVAPLIQDCVASAGIVASPTGILPYPNNKTIASLSKIGRVVTLALVAGDPTSVPASKPGDVATITGNADGYDATYSVISVISSSVVTLLSPDAAVLPDSAGGSYFANIYLVETTSEMTLGDVSSSTIGMMFTIAGATDASYDGTWQLRALIDIGFAQFLYLYIPTGSGAPSGGGTVTIIGNVAAGLHLASYSFLTRNGYITKPAPFASYVAAGALPVLLSGIPTGPINVDYVVVMFTPVVTPPANLGDFYYLEGPVPTPSIGTFPTMIIPNGTATAVFDFTDAVLIASTLGTPLFDLVELGECACLTSYSNRLFASGERNKLQNLLNMSFCGGFYQFGFNSYPTGWQIDPTNNNYLGGSQEPYDSVFGSSYKVTGDGASATRGLITQQTVADFLGVPILIPNTEYSVRVRLKKGGGITQGNAVVKLGASTYTVPVANISSTAFTEFIANFGFSTGALALEVTGTPDNNGYILFDNVEVFPTNQPYFRNQVRASFAGDPESFSNTTGLLVLGQASSESVRSMFVLIDNKLYMVTESGTYVTSDDGANEPSSWTINTVSRRVGTGSVRGVASAESWAIIVAQDGIYIMWGGEPVKISQEIQPDWDTINRAYDQTIYAMVDTANQRIHVGIPTGDSIVPNVEFVCDYSQLTNEEGRISGQDIAGSVQVQFSGTDTTASGRARKWTLWNISMACAAIVTRSDGSTDILRGNATSTGKVYNQVVGQLSDDGENPIHSAYQTSFIPPSSEVAAGLHRHLCKYLTGYANGVGTMNLTMYGARNQRAVTLSSLPLQNPAPWDFEKNINFLAERMSVLVETNAIGSWFDLSKLTLTMQPDMVSPVRGTS